MTRFRMVCAFYRSQASWFNGTSQHLFPLVDPPSEQVPCKGVKYDLVSVARLEQASQRLEVLRSKRSDGASHQCVCMYSIDPSAKEPIEGAGELVVFEETEADGAWPIF